MAEALVRFLHGTTSAKAAIILTDGFLPGTCFTTSVDDAVFYAATGGEADLQRREEEWEEDNGYPPREDYGSDTMSMMEDLYPVGQTPMIIEVYLSEEILLTGEEDTGAEGALRFAQHLHPDIVRRIVEVDWEAANLEGYDPVGEGPTLP